MTPFFIIFIIVQKNIYSKNILLYSVNGLFFVPRGVILIEKTGEKDNG